MWSCLMVRERFLSVYSLTGPFAKGSRSAMNDVFENLPELDAGVYNDGEITLVADSYDLDAFASWPEAFWENRFPLATTAFGDFFLWSRNTRQIEYLELQRQTLLKATQDPAWFLEGFLAGETVRKGLLREPLVKTLVARLGGLTYGKCFILEPWQMLGGVDVPENYTVGDAGVYINLVGQTAFSK